MSSAGVAHAQEGHGEAHGGGEKSQTAEFVLLVLLLGAAGYALFGPKSPPTPKAEPAVAVKATPSAAAAASARRRNLPPGAASVLGNRSLPEMQYLQGVRRSLAQGNADDALRELSDYPKRFPDGKIADDVTMLQVEAYVRKGDREKAAKVAEPLLTKSPDSRQARRAKALLATPPGEQPATRGPRPMPGGPMPGGQMPRGPMPGGPGAGGPTPGGPTPGGQTPPAP